MEFLEAWGIVNEHLYFAIKEHGTETRDVFLENDFRGMFDFMVVKKRKQKHEFWVEFYTTDSETLTNRQHNEKLNFSAKTYEEAVIKIATWLIENFGKVDLWDYFVIDKQNPEILNGQLNEANKNHWNLEQIKTKKKEWEKMKTKNGALK